jgi:hypothetical protein
MLSCSRVLSIRCWTDISSVQRGARVGRSFDYEELIRLFPSLSSGTVIPLRCVSPVRGHGTYIRRLRSQAPQHGDVEVAAVPAGVLSVHFAHTWPRELSTDEVARLDDALLLGLAEGVAREEWPPMECALTSMAVGYVGGETTPAGVRIAAAMAVRDMCRRQGWEGNERGDLPPDVA